LQRVRPGAAVEPKVLEATAQQAPGESPGMADAAAKGNGLSQK
jgi:hypothetical protein